MVITINAEIVGRAPFGFRFVKGRAWLAFGMQHPNSSQVENLLLVSFDNWRAIKTRATVRVNEIAAS